MVGCLLSEKKSQDYGFLVFAYISNNENMMIISRMIAIHYKDHPELSIPHFCLLNENNCISVEKDDDCMKNDYCCYGYGKNDCDGCSEK